MQRFLTGQPAGDLDGRIMKVTLYKTRVAVPDPHEVGFRPQRLGHRRESVRCLVFGDPGQVDDERATRRIMAWDESGVDSIVKYGDPLASQITPALFCLACSNGNRS
jgi:hypothetical protein